MQNIELRQDISAFQSAPSTTFISLQILSKASQNKNMQMLKFDLPYAALVQVNVYDCYGHEIQTVLDEWKNSGIHIIPCAHDRLSHGVYVYQVKTNYDTALKTLTVA